MDVLISVAHTAAIRVQDMIENGSVAILNGLQFAEIIRKQFEMECVHFGFLRDLFRNVVVVRYRVMAIRYAQEWIT